jgi:hypothetical protein
MHPVYNNRTGQPWDKPGHDEFICFAYYSADARSRPAARSARVVHLSLAPSEGVRTHTSNNEYTGIARHSRTQWF